MAANKESKILKNPKLTEAYFDQGFLNICTMKIHQAHIS